MELKHDLRLLQTYPVLLLIVPYGIETHNVPTLKVELLLLIVPYGIETEGTDV